MDSKIGLKIHSNLSQSTQLTALTYEKILCSEHSYNTLKYT